MFLYANVPRWVREMPEHLKTQEMCNEAVRIEPNSLPYVTDQYKTEAMCSEAVRNKPYTLLFVP